MFVLLRIQLRNYVDIKL